ncbi:uncharacterized protein LOC143621969 [Bidens hawaiensis]|uniref:uncharacterized protein LOC143621969 n=1 Tax=Bidens hawaiensis TaxID=980011 RepID=UPI00404AFD4E
MARDPEVKIYIMFENKNGTTNKPPKLLNWDKGPYRPTVSSPTRPVPIPFAALTYDDKKLLLDNEKAYGVLSVCLSIDIAQTLRECTTTKALWDGLVEKFEGNLDMRESKKDMLKGDFNMFKHIQGESITSFIHRFETLHTKMRSAGIKLEYSEVNKRLLNSLPYKLNSSVTTIKRTTNSNTTTLRDLTSAIKSFEMDDKLC